jgi:RNA polymerase sigma-70 factor (ECF subfamily)
MVEGGEVFARVMDLPENLRTVVALHYFEDMTTPEIARILKISDNAVRARLCRGRNLLKTALEDIK